MTKAYNLIEICHIEKGKTGIKSAIPGNYPLVVTSEVRQTNNTYQFDCEAVCIPLVSSTGHGHASIKRIHYQKGKFALGSILCAITPKDTKKVSAKYLYIYLSLNKEKLLVSLMKGAANVSLNINKLNTVQIPIPSIEVQRKIIETFDSVTQKTATILSSIDKDIGLISLLKETLLNTAIQGKLVPQDENDEDAGILLEKIKEEKEKLIKEGKIKKDKPLPEIKPDEIPFEIPKSWRWVKLPEIVDFRAKYPVKRGPFGSTLKKEFFVPTGYKVYEQKNAIKNDFNIGTYYINEEKFNELKAFSVKARDIIISCSGTIGKTAIIPENAERGIINQALLKITLNQEVCINSYFLYMFKSYFITTGGIEDAKGSAIKNVASVEVLKNTPIPLPPYAEQQRIVEKIDQLILLIDKLEQKINQSKELTSKLNEAILNEALEK